MDDADRASEIEFDRVQKSIRLINRDLKQQPEDIYCIECGEEIEEERRKVMPNSIRCIKCQTLEEKLTRAKKF